MIPSQKAKPDEITEKIPRCLKLCEIRITLPSSAWAKKRKRTPDRACVAYALD